MMKSKKFGDKTFRKKEKLRKNFQFQKVYKHGKSSAAKNTVLFIRRNDLEYNRLGISVSKKVGKSVVRHRLKRLYIEVFRQLKGKFIKNGYDLVVIGRKGAGTLSYKEVYREMERLLIRGKLLK